MDPHDRSRRGYYEDEFQQDYYQTAHYAAERLPFPDAAAHLYQQNAMQAQIERAHGNVMPQYAQEDMRYFDQMQQSDFNNAAHTAYYKQQKSPRGGSRNRRNTTQEGAGHRRDRLQDARDDERYEELHEEVFAPHSRATISGTRTSSTERTPGIPTTSSSRSSSTSRYGSSSSSSFESYDINLGANIMSALNDMAGNIKKIGGIRCSQAGPDTAELQMKINLPLYPVEGFNNAMATLSPKNCGKNMDMEEKFLGTMDQIQGNMMPVYKSLFESQSEVSDELDDDESESVYEDERFLSKAAPNLKQRQQQHQQQQRQFETTNVIASPVRAQHKDGIPSQIVVSNQSSGVSSAGDSWDLLPSRDKPRPSSNMNDGNHRDEQWIAASRQTLQVENAEVHQMGKSAKSKPRDFKSNMEIPKVIDVDGENVVECYSDLTTGFRKPATPNASASNVPASKTKLSSDEAVGQSKSSFQRNGKKKGTASNPDANGQKENEAAVLKSDPPENDDDGQDVELEEERRLADELENAKRRLAEELEKAKKLEEEQLEKAKKLEEERLEKAKKLEEQQKQHEAEAKAAKKALRRKRLEEKVEEELQAARDALEAKKLEEQRKQYEAEARAAEQKALEKKKLEELAKRLEEERKVREAEAKVAEEAKRLENERKRIEAEAKAKEMALEAKRLKEERKRREAEEAAAEECRKAKQLEKQRKLIEAETKAAQEALAALYAKKSDEERRQREAKIEGERKRREAEKKERKASKLKAVRERVEAEAQAAAEEAEALESERMRIEAETRAVESALERRKLGKERKRVETQKKAAENARKARKSEREIKRVGSRASLYKVQGFNDYCESVASFQIDADGNRQDIDLSDEDTSDGERSASSNQDSDVHSREEDSTVGASSSDEQSNSGDSYSSEGSDIFTDATSVAEDSEDVRSTSSTERLRNNTGINHQFSSGRSVNTMDRTVRSFQTKGTTRESPRSSKFLSKSKFPTKPSKFTSDVPIPIAATMSTLQTFDQGTVYSGHHSLGRFIKSSDESVVSTYSHQSVISAKPIALPVNKSPRKAKKESIPGPKTRSSIVGYILSLILTMALRITFTVVIFLFTWTKHIAITIGKKQAAKLDCTPTNFALQPDQAIRREEIQDRSTERRNHQNAIQQHYLGYEEPHQDEHYATTMIIKPPSYFADDSDEVGTCVESIVPDAHHPNMSDGKMSTWKITQKNTETSSLSSPPSTSFRVLKGAYSALSSKRESEKSNWLDQPTIDDEMSYYE